MAVPDVTTLTDDELATLSDDAKNESLRRGVLSNINEAIRNAVQAAKNNGITKVKVGNYLTSIVNDIYSQP